MKGRRARFSSYLPLTNWGLSLPWASISPSENQVHNSGPADFSQVDKACRDLDTIQSLYKYIWRPNTCQILSRHGFSAISFAGSRFDTSSPTLMILVSSSIKTCYQGRLCHMPFTLKYELQSRWGLRRQKSNSNWLKQKKVIGKSMSISALGRATSKGLRICISPFLGSVLQLQAFFPAKAQWMTFLGQDWVTCPSLLLLLQIWLARLSHRLTSTTRGWSQLYPNSRIEKWGRGGSQRKTGELLPEEGEADAMQERTTIVPFSELTIQHFTSYLEKLRPRERMRLAWGQDLPEVKKWVCGRGRTIT